MGKKVANAALDARLLKGLSSLERKFLLAWAACGGPQLAQQWPITAERKWRLDFALPQILVAIEIEGGIWSGGRHVRGSGFINDCEKYNAATLAGWRIVRLTEAHLATAVIEKIVAWVAHLSMLQGNHGV